MKVDIKRNCHAELVEASHKNNGKSREKEEKSVQCFAGIKDQP